MSSVVSLKKVVKEYGILENKTLAVDDVSFSIEKGSFVGIMGTSGSGKSTLLNIISTIDKATYGSVLVNSNDISAMSENDIAKFRRDNLGFVFQDYNLLDTLTLYENIALAMIIKKHDKNEIDNLISQIAQKLNIASVMDKFPYEVSGGQRQRCACARAVIVNPQLILADEPTGALDSHSAKSLMETFVQLNKELGATILMVTHDAFSASYCDRILFMQDGKITRELQKDKAGINTFFHQILSVLGQTGGVADDVC